MTDSLYGRDSRSESDSPRQFPKSQPMPRPNCARTFLAMRMRCTSSGPSASRRVRAPWYMAIEGQVARHAGRAPDLDGAVDDALVGGRHEDLDGRDVGAGIALVGHLLGAVDRHQPGRLDVDVGVGDEALDELLGLEQAAVHLAYPGPLRP